MVKAKHIIAGGVLAAGIIVYFVFWHNEEARVKRQFKSIARKVEKRPEENKILAATKANRISEAFTRTCKIHAPAYRFSRDISSGDLSTIVLSARSQYSELSVKLYDFDIDFPDKDTAQVRLTARMEGKLTTGESIEDLHELKCKLQKIEDVWRIREVEVVQVLRK
jgi:hypothetical protein